MASSKCEAAASAPGSGRPPPSLGARCKMVFTKVNIGHSASQVSRSSAPRAEAGLLGSQLTLGLKRHLKLDIQKALAKIAEEQWSPTSFLPGATPRSDLSTPDFILGSSSVMEQIFLCRTPIVLF